MNYLEVKYKILKLISKIKTQYIYSFFFKNMGKNSKIIRPLVLRNTKYINVGKNITIHDQVFMMVEYKQGTCPNLSIGDGSTIGHFNHIVCCDEVKIGKNVLTADRVYISDNCHCYADVSLPISKQGTYSSGKTEIGDETWLGENVCVISAKIGTHCVIGANSVVTRDIPDYCVAVGSPAKVIKKYDMAKKEWINTNEQE